MGPQSLVEVARAHAGVDNGRNNENKCYDSEKSKRATSGKVFPIFFGLIHADELEKEVCESTKIEELEAQSVKREHKMDRGTVSTYNDNNHAGCVLATSEERREEEDDNGHRDGSKSESKFHISLACHDDHELDSKSKEEEKVKLQESDVDLCRVSFAQIPAISTRKRQT